MTESREQFRGRIWRVFEERQYTYPEVAQSLAAHRAAAEAVYAEALRDVKEAAYIAFPRSRDRVRNFIDIYAASLGIDLDDAP